MLKPNVKYRAELLTKSSPSLPVLRVSAKIIVMSLVLRSAHGGKAFIYSRLMKKFVRDSLSDATIKNVSGLYIHRANAKGKSRAGKST